jgi:hypothetical protein
MFFDSLATPSRNNFQVAVQEIDNALHIGPSTAVGGTTFSGSTGLAMLANGKVGIGTTAPDNPLEVVGADSGIKISSASSNRPHLRFECGTAEKMRLSANSAYGAIGDSSDANRYMAFKDGKVGIGTTAPPVLLAVSGTNPGIDLMEGAASRFRAELGSNHTYLSTIGAYSMVLRINQTAALTLNSSQNAIFAGTITENSSIAIKENIFDLNTTLDKINRVRPVRYNKKTTKNKKEIGFIAEELAEIFPELVENDENGNPASVNYTRAVTVLFDGFKQMYKELKEIKEKIK